MGDFDNDKFYHQISIREHNVDYYWDGEIMIIFSEQKLKDAGIKILGKDTKLMRYEAEKKLCA